ncbi:MAG TPA: 3-deoxy-D-manno-octulosonic acid transferase [Terriglobales bacterium]|nr:3-deoxy-D-manno-octulosonic acid transferase [Terriglobales bacterium]
MYLLYSVLLAAALLVASPYWLFQMLRHGKYRRGLSERLGRTPGRILYQQKHSVWIHAVSLGEVLAVTELIRRLQIEFPDHRIAISTTTDTGQTLAASRFGPENVFYFPFDLQFCVTPYLDALQPDLLIIAETEFWPNLLRLAKQRGTRVAIVNARISDRSFPGYRRWRPLLGRVLNHVDLFLAQTAEDARRLAQIGAPSDRVFVSGNLKFDAPAPTTPAIVNQLRSVLTSENAGPVLVCGSTVDGEESLLISAFQAVLTRYPHASMLLAPRHPERFATVAGLLQTSDLKFFKRSTWKEEQLSGGIVLIDSIGELASLYALADVAFVGGSLVPRGGHSILEPAQYGVPILVGPHTENFRDIVELFRKQNAVRIVSADALTSTILGLLGNEAERGGLGRRALETLQSQRGATEFTLQKVRALLEPNLHEAQHA